MSSNQFPCDKCGFALTQINPSQNITLKCKCKEQTINYYEYLNIVKVHPLNKEIKCENHNKAFSFFCTLCERHICGLCEVKSEDKKIIMKEHIKKNHCKECIDEDEIFQSDSCQNCKKFEMYIIDISKKFSIEKHLTKLNSIAHHIKDYIYKLKKKVIQRLVNEINQIESYYETISNTNYIQIMKSIINEYNTKYPNYYVINNIRNNCNLCNINISTCSKEEDTNEVINYLKTYATTIHHIKLTQKETKPMKEPIFNLCLLKDGRIASFSYKNTVNIYDPKNNYKIDIVIQSNGNVSMLEQLSDNNLITYSNQISIFNIQKYHYHLIYSKKYDNAITSMLALSNNRIALALKSKGILILNAYEDNPLHTLNIKQDEEVPTMLEIKERNLLLSIGKSNTLQVWNLSTNQCTQTVNKVICNSKAILQIDSEHVLIGSIINILVINVTKGIIESTIEYNVNDRFNGCYSLSKLDLGNVLCGCDNGRYVLYNIITNTYEIISMPTRSKIYDIIVIDDFTFISSSKEPNLCIWKYTH